MEKYLSDSFEKAIRNYLRTFNDSFPLRQFVLSTDDEVREVIRIMNDCIKKGKPYDGEYVEGADY